MLEQLLAGFINAFSLGNLVALLFGTAMGIITGIVPGLGPMVGMVVLLPFTFAYTPDIALSVMLGVFSGGYFGGAIPAILIRTPGVPSSLITSLDGYPLTQKGEAETALSFALVGSFAGGIISLLILIFLSNLLAHVAASFGPPEHFAVAVFGVIIVVMAFRKRLAQGLILLGFGFWISTVGIDGTTLSERFTFGTLAMRNGLDLIPVFLGLFGIGQTLLMLEREILETSELKLSRNTLDFTKLLRAFTYWKTLIRSGIIGTFIGLLPGAGSILGSFMSYDAAKRFSKEKEKFGKGAAEGCLASEAGNNAVPAGAMIPLLTLGIPGEALSAVLLGVFTINGIYPGPLLLVKEPVLINTLYSSMLLINLFAFFILAFLIRPLSMIVKIPSKILAVIIMVLCLVGIYSVNIRIFDVAVAIVFGGLGYILLRLKWPLVTLVLGVVLGGIMEKRLRQTLSLGDGSLAIMLQRPICIALILMSVLIVAGPFIMDWIKTRRTGKNTN